LGRNGVLYGTTQYGGNDTGGDCIYYGAEHCGIVFELAPPKVSGDAWKESILYIFGGPSVPMASLTLSPSGVLYGTTWDGGTYGKGTIFSIGP
jgi:uncharacterized repeat protein (TIGR03803 family)